MSRGVKDLRDLVVVSRLSYRDSDSESDDGRAGLITPFEQLDIHPRSETPPYLERASSTTPPSSADSGLGKRRKKKRKKPKGYITSSSQNQPHQRRLHEFPKSKPLPAVGLTLNNINSEDALNHFHANGDEELRTDYTAVINYLDEETVADWLQRANHNLKELTIWCTDINFVTFAQFWITEFGIEKRCEILALEHSILLDELTLAFKEGLESRKLQQKDIVEFLAALLREYPKKLTSSAGVYLFLDYLDTFTSERTAEYRQILSDVKLSTKNKQHVQLILASRCFMLINVWIAIVNFYRQIFNSEPPLMSTDEMPLHREKNDIHFSRLTQAIDLGLVEVVHYYLYSGKISAGHVDGRQKTLLHSAVAANQPTVVEYLLRKWTGCLDVNRPCDTGNSPLHVAVNLGNSRLVQLLLNMPDIEVNKENSECGGATPLHLAVLHGHTDIVRQLLKYKADIQKLMSGQSVLDIARDFDHMDIVELLSDVYSSS